MPSSGLDKQGVGMAGGGGGCEGEDPSSGVQNGPSQEREARAACGKPESHCGSTRENALLEVCRKHCKKAKRTDRRFEALH